MNTMNNKLSSLERLEKLLVNKKNQDLKLFKSKLLKYNTIAIYNNIFDSINKLKEYEREKSRIDWKNGYIECVLDVGESFGNSREESYPNKKELKIIDEASYNY